MPNRLNRDSAPASDEPQAANDLTVIIELLRIWSSTSNGSPENPSQNMEFCMQLEAVNLLKTKFGR